MAVSDNERKIENLRKDHETWGAKLNELQMTDKDGGGKSQPGHGSKQVLHKHFSPEIEALDNRIVILSKNKEKSDVLIKKVNLIFDQVQGWSSKVIQKVDQ